MNRPRPSVNDLPRLPARTLQRARLVTPMPDLSGVVVDRFKLRALREERKWTLEDVARAVGLTNRQRLSDIERGYREADGNILLRLALLYGVTLDQLATFPQTSAPGEPPSAANDRNLRILRQKNLP